MPRVPVLPIIANAYRFRKHGIAAVPKTDLPGRIIGRRVKHKVTAGILQVPVFAGRAGIQKASPLLKLRPARHRQAPPRVVGVGVADGKITLDLMVPCKGGLGLGGGQLPAQHQRQADEELFFHKIRNMKNKVL